MSDGLGQTIAILGSGSIGLRHARTFLGVGCDVIIVPARKNRLSELRDEGFDARDFEQLPSVDGIIVATRTASHVEDVARCLELAPVLVEKPPAIDAAGARLLAERSATSGRLLHVAFCLRHHVGMQFLKTNISRLGQLYGVEAECFSWLPDWRSSDHRDSYSASPQEGGVLRDLIHEVDLVQWLLGAVGTCLSATVENARILDLPGTVDESAFFVVNYGSIVANFRVSYARRPASRVLRIFGEHGMLECDLIASSASAVDVAGSVLDALTWRASNQMYEAQAQEWLASLGGAVPETLAKIEEAASAMAVIDAARAIGSYQ